MKKIFSHFFTAILLTIFLCGEVMAYSAIDIGAAAANYDSVGSNLYTCVTLDNPANASGVLTSFELWYNTDATGVKAGTFYGSGTSYQMRDYEAIGNVTSGSKQTFTGKNCDVVTGDFITFYSTTGAIEANGTGGAGEYYLSGDYFIPGANTYTNYPNYKFALYATGVTIPDAPTSVSATDDLTDKVTITWTAGTGETGGHRVYRDTVDVSGVVAHGTATYDDVPAAGTYSYTVKAINAAGLSAASSADNGTRVTATATGSPQIIIF